MESFERCAGVDAAVRVSGDWVVNVVAYGADVFFHGVRFYVIAVYSVKDFITKNYPGARIVEYEIEKGNLEVDIIDDISWCKILCYCGIYVMNWKRLVNEDKKTDSKQTFESVLELFIF